MSHGSEALKRNVICQIYGGRRRICRSGNIGNKAMVYQQHHNRRAVTERPEPVPEGGGKFESETNNLLVSA